MVELSKEFVTLKINPELNAENAELQKKYRVPGYPTVAFVSAEEELISLNVGMRNAEQFTLLMREALEFKQLKALVKKNPEDREATAKLALIYAKGGNFEQGKPYVEKAMELDPENKTGLLPELHLHSGLYYGMNAEGENAEANFKKAEEHFGAVVEKYPESSTYEIALLYLGITYAIQEKNDLAVSTLEKLENAKDSTVKTRAKQFLEQVKDTMKK